MILLSFLLSSAPKLNLSDPQSETMLVILYPKRIVPKVLFLSIAEILVMLSLGLKKAKFIPAVLHTQTDPTVKNREKIKNWTMTLISFSSRIKNRTNKETKDQCITKDKGVLIPHLEIIIRSWILDPLRGIPRSTLITMGLRNQTFLKLDLNQKYTIILETLKITKGLWKFCFWLLWPDFS